jgi:hypothetical protein
MGARKSSHYLLLRRGVVPHDTTIDADIDCSGFAALRLREQPVQSTRVASAPMLLRSPLRRLPLAEITTKRALTPDLSQPPRIHSEGS